MKAIVLFGPRDVKYTDFPEPPMGETSVKIAVAYCGLCGTDLHKFEGKAGSRPVTYPVPLGHEASGVVVEVGKAVTDFKPGDRVTVDPNWSCGHCYYCKNGKRHLCENSKGVVKGMATYICPPQENVYHIPDTLSLRDASLCEPLACCLHGIDLLGIIPGETVAIVGFGAIGMLMLQLCKKAGAARIVVLEPNESKREAALKMGASLFLNSTMENLNDAIRNAGIQCVDKVLECVGIPAAIETALSVAGRGATVVLFGVAAPEASVVFYPYQAFQKELVIKTSYINPATTDRAIALLNSGVIDTDASIGNVLLPEELPEELETRNYCRQGKVIVKLSDAE